MLSDKDTLETLTKLSERNDFLPILFLGIAGAYRWVSALIASYRKEAEDARHMLHEVQNQQIQRLSTRITSLENNLDKNQD